MLKAGLLAQSHRPQYSGDRVFTGRENRSYKEHLDMLKDGLGKQWCKCCHEIRNLEGQAQHTTPPLVKEVSASRALPALSKSKMDKGELSVDHYSSHEGLISLHQTCVGELVLVAAEARPLIVDSPLR
jgi:hypothetical protein